MSAESEINKMMGFISKEFPFEIKVGETPVDVAIRLLKHYAIEKKEVLE